MHEFACRMQGANIACEAVYPIKLVGVALYFIIKISRVLNLAAIL